MAAFTGCRIPRTPVRANHTQNQGAIFWGWRWQRDAEAAYGTCPRTSPEIKVTGRTPRPERILSRGRKQDRSFWIESYQEEKRSAQSAAFP
jgi:hypothetical protein